MSDRTPDAGIELVSIRWERVQVIIEARTAPGVVIDPRAWDLRLEGGDTRYPPTHMDIADGRVKARYNVISGPGQDPLAAGRWTLGARMTGSPGVIDPRAVTVEFQLIDGMYMVRPVFDGATGSVSLEVTFDTALRRVTEVTIPTRIRRFFRRILVRTRRAGFLLLVWSSGVSHRRKRRQVLFASALISELTGNLRAVHDRMIERGLDREYDLVTALRPRPGEKRGFLGRIRLASSLARSDVILLDDSYPPLHWLKLDPAVRIVQLWHAAGAFKTVGYSRVGGPADADRFARVHDDYTAAIVSSAFDVPFYAEAFGMSEDRVIPTGIPRMDRFFDERARAAGFAAAHAAYPESVGRTTILFAPTFRGTGPKSAFYDFDQIDYAALHAVAVEKDAVVIIKMHPFITEPLGIPDALRDRLIDGYRASIDVNDLLFAVDLLITDYSSIVFEYSTLERPMLFFAYDLEEYIATRDFYVPFESFVPGRIVTTWADLLDAIRRDDYQVEKVTAFADTHFAYHDSNSSDRVIDQLVLAR